MFSKFALLVALAFAASGFAGASDPEYTCNVGKLQCCGQYQAPTSDKGKEIIKSLLNVSAKDISGQLGAQCNPIDAIGKGNGAGCPFAPTCCSKVYQSQKSLFGSVGVNCSPATAIV